MTSVAFYNPKTGVGCTSLVYHLAWMYVRLGYRVVAVDADPQRDLTGALFGFDELPLLEFDETRVLGATLIDAMHSVRDARAFISDVAPSLGLVRSGTDFEEMAAEFSDAHGLCYSGARSQIPEDLGTARIRRLFVGLREHCDLVLIDCGGGIGVAPCLAVTSADALVWPVATDPTACAGLVDGALAVGRWTDRWRAYAARVLDKQAIARRRAEDQALHHIGGTPVETLEEGDASWLGRGPRSLGYVITGDPHYAGRLTESRHRTDLITREIAARYRERLQLYHEDIGLAPGVAGDDSRLGVLTSWVDLRERGIRARKPMFELSPADGAIGSTATAVRRCAAEYEALAKTIARRLGVAAPKRLSG